MGAWVVGGLLGLLFGAIALFGEGWQRALVERRLRRHHCPTPCTESYWCRCGCSDGWTSSQRGRACAVCGTEIVVDDEDDDRDWGPYRSGPARQTSWGKEREERDG